MSSTPNHNQYWEQLSILPVDLEHLVNYLVETETPKGLDELTHELIRYRNQQMVHLMEEALSQGRIYRPEETYEVEASVIFPHLGNIVGEVIGVRTGHNPEYAPFSVIKVKMEDEETREFAAELDEEHPLNNASYLPTEELTEEDLYEEYGEALKEELHESLQTDARFLTVGYQWFVRDLVMEISPGQLNIAEALLDMAEGGPVRTTAFLEEMDLPDEIPESLQIFSLEYALLRDHRFDEVGPAGYALWHLREMEPREVLETPRHLQYMPIPYNRGVLDDVMLALEKRIDDEWSDVAFNPDEVEEPITVVLSYPHWRSGTVPLASRVRKLFPTARITDRIRFTFVDGKTGDEFPGWVVRSGRYVYGLEDWFEEKQIVVGSYVDLQHSDDPERIIIEARPLGSKRREWIRTVTVDNGQLAFEVRRAAVTCEYDELAAVIVPDPENIEELASDKLRQLSLESLLKRIFDGLAGLSLQRAVHAWTLYSVTNLVRRVPPAPILATLATSSTYASLGDNYWAYRGESS